MGTEGVGAFIWQLSEIRKNSSWVWQKCTFSFITDWIALRAREGVYWASGEMVLLSTNV